MSAESMKIITKEKEILELLNIFRYVPVTLSKTDVTRAIAQYDGDNSKPYCDLVYTGLDVLRRYLDYVEAT